MSQQKAAASAYGVLKGDESLTVSSSAVALASVATGALTGLITNGAEPIRVRWGTPTASVGHYLNPYSVLEVFNSMADIKFIRAGSSDSTIFVTYFG
ncbi:MAG: hypothetical protein HOE75_09885 [Chloroflexi bacterium]|jgi:hypothetical protein|nr:hypothetical protein [Chloroflexota bacterium]